MARGQVSHLWDQAEQSDPCVYPLTVEMNPHYLDPIVSAPNPTYHPVDGVECTYIIHYSVNVHKTYTREKGVDKEDLANEMQCRMLSRALHPNQTF